MDNDDRLAQIHDLQYLLASRPSDLDQADDQMIDELSYLSLHGVIGKIGLKLRKAFQLNKNFVTLHPSDRILAEDLLKIYKNK